MEPRGLLVGRARGPLFENPAESQQRMFRSAFRQRPQQAHRLFVSPRLDRLRGQPLVILRRDRAPVVGSVFLKTKSLIAMVVAGVGDRSPATVEIKFVTLARALADRSHHEP
jgi:hypothetical protein